MELLLDLQKFDLNICYSYSGIGFIILNDVSAIIQPLSTLLLISVVNHDKVWMGMILKWKM